MSTQAFALRADHENFAGGTLAWGPGQQTFNVGEELEKNGGVIIVEMNDATPTDPGQQLLAEALSAYPALKHIPLTEARQRAHDAAKARAKDIPAEEAKKAAQHADEEPLDEATLLALDNESLWDIVDEQNIQGLNKSANKGDLVNAILDHQKEGGAR